MLSVFSCVYLLAFLREMSILIFGTFYFFLFLMCFWYWAAWAVCMFSKWIPCGCPPLQISLPILMVVPVFPWGFPLSMQKLLRLIRSYFLICGLFFIFLRGRSTKNLLHSCQIVSCLYFSQEIIVSILTTVRGSTLIETAHPGQAP